MITRIVTPALSHTHTHTHTHPSPDTHTHTQPPTLSSTPFHSIPFHSAPTRDPSPPERGRLRAAGSTVCAAVSGWAAWMISGSRSRCRAWPRCGCGCAGPGSWSWRRIWSSGGTCAVWPLCETLRGSACLTYWRRSPHTSGTYGRERHRDQEGGTEGCEGRRQRKKSNKETTEDSGTDLVWFRSSLWAKCFWTCPLLHVHQCLLHYLNAYCTTSMFSNK